MVLPFDLKVITNIGTLRVNLDCTQSSPLLLNLKKCVQDQVLAEIGEINFSMDTSSGLLDITCSNSCEYCF
jgi:hypothetical protein